MAAGVETGVVLVVEDDDSIRLLLREMLGMGGFDAVEASDGEAALPLALEHVPDAILLDIGLPGVDGLEVLDSIKAQPLLAGIPVIMVTAWGEPEYVERALHSGAHDYVRKPFDTTELIARVEAAVRIKARHDAVRAANEMLSEQAAVDALTGLPNRRALDEALAEAVATGEWTGLVMLDLDGFKAVNDEHGHPAGDAILCDVAARRRAISDPRHTPGRWGGDEFVVLAPGADEEEAERIANRIADAIAATPLTIPGGSIPLSACVGAAAGRGESAASLVARADAALYERKSAGRSES
jgi:two-component system, cell cycle response regulator